MNKLKCHFCGKTFVKVCAHVWQKHNMQAREYKQMMGYDVKRGILTDDHRELLSIRAIENGMRENLKKWGEKSRLKKGHGLKYKRSNETLERLKIRGYEISKPKGTRIEPRSCGGCGVIFTPKYSAGKYCSIKCYQDTDPISLRKNIGAQK